MPGSTKFKMTMSVQWQSASGSRTIFWNTL